MAHSCPYFAAGQENEEVYVKVTDHWVLSSSNNVQMQVVGLRCVQQVLQQYHFIHWSSLMAQLRQVLHGSSAMHGKLGIS